MKKLIEIDDTILTKLKVLSAFEGLSVKALMEKAIELFVKTKEKRMFAIFEFQRVFRGHKGRENAEVQRALKAIEGQTGPLKLKIKRLEKDRDQVGKTKKKNL